MTWLPQFDLGSSPRWRGAPAVDRVPIACVRIIPALAGSTVFVGVLGIIRQDHPRAGGEHS